MAQTARTHQAPQHIGTPLKPAHAIRYLGEIDLLPGRLVLQDYLL